MIGQTTLLIDPYPRQVKEPQIYDTVCVHAEYSTSESKPRTDFSVRKLGKKKKKQLFCLINLLLNILLLGLSFTTCFQGLNSLIKQ